MKSQFAEKCNKNVALAKDFAGQDLSGWELSEKFDGVRGYHFNGSFFSRTNKVWKLPPEFIEQFPPDLYIDGEFTRGRGTFNETSGDMRAGRWGANMNFVIFDFPELAGGIRQRLDCGFAILAAYSKYKALGVLRVILVTCQNNDHAFQMLDELVSQGAEGLIARHPKNDHKPKRSSDLLKLKKFHDKDAVVSGYKLGKGKYKDCMGTLVCTREDGLVIEIGSGFTDAQRFNPPAIGTKITYKYFEETANSLPRFPIFKGIRAD